MKYELFSKTIGRRDPTGICRFCLTANGLRRLQTKEIAQLFNQITHQNLYVTADHPAFICTICEANLRLAAKISNDIQAIEKCWNKYIEEMHTLKEVKVEYVDDEEVNFETVEMIIEPVDQMYHVDYLDVDSKPEYEPHSYVADGSVENYDDSISDSNENDENDSPKLSSSPKSKGCDRCNMTGLLPDELKTHQQRCHKETPQFACDICQARYSSRYGIHTHMKRHMQGSTNKAGSKLIKRYECDHCGDRFSKKQNLMEHALRHAGGDAALHVCHICGIAKRTKVLMTNHLKSHDTNYVSKKNSTARARSTKRYYTCWMCPTRIDFNTLDELKSHRKNLHHDFQCNICKNGFMTNEALQSHILIHGNQDRPHLCKFCGGTFAKIGHLKSHIQGKHAQQKPFPCDKCTKGFVHRYQLQAHIRIFHDKIKAFQCTECPTSFGHAKSRVWHMRTVHKM
ncbi:zinc finger protein 37 homolog [Bradysia coprophila]|uniref:zinc finger protein 37 homolog n=1 Tax=Bradysia coprophila TaxID=38358 RepID=UPI00187DA695|nr:zinc finger protein 37 homolog [Bradysia coprophila]